MMGDTEISKMAAEAIMRLCVVLAIHGLLKYAMGHVIEHTALGVLRYLYLLQSSLE
jgi:hypothetical protein